MHRERMERNRFFVPCTKPEKLVRMTSEGEGEKKIKIRERENERKREEYEGERGLISLPSDKWPVRSQSVSSRSSHLSVFLSSPLCIFVHGIKFLSLSLSFWERKRRNKERKRGEEEWDERIFGIGYEKGLNDRSSSFSSTPSLFSFHSNFTPFPFFLFSIPTNWRMGEGEK